MKNERFVLIMAGGEGARFWPYSTSDFPKQFLSLFGNNTMMEKTFDRMNKLVPQENIFVSTNKRFFNLTHKYLPKLSPGNIITEPIKRNTFPAMALFLATLKQRGISGTVIMVAADHIIGDEEHFLNICRKAFEIAENKGKIITFGIVPTRIETNYGYLHPETAYNFNDINYYGNVNFVEKPNYEKAKIFYKEGGYFWNSGIFTFDIDNLLSEIKNIVAGDYELISKYIKRKIKLKNFFENLTANSIDYIIMEKSKNIVMLKSDFIWDDVGNWEALFRLKANKNGNVIEGNIDCKNIKNSIIITDNYEIKAKNLNNFIFVEKDGKCLFSSIDGLKYIKEALKDFRGKKNYKSENVKVEGMNTEYLVVGLNNMEIKCQVDTIFIKQSKM